MHNPQNPCFTAVFLAFFISIMILAPSSCAQDAKRTVSTVEPECTEDADCPQDCGEGLEPSCERMRCRCSPIPDWDDLVEVGIIEWPAEDDASRQTERVFSVLPIDEWQETPVSPPETGAPPAPDREVRVPIYEDLGEAPAASPSEAILTIPQEDFREIPLEDEPSVPTQGTDPSPTIPENKTAAPSPAEILPQAVKQEQHETAALSVRIRRSSNATLLESNGVEATSTSELKLEKGSVSIINGDLEVEVNVLPDKATDEAESAGISVPSAIELKVVDDEPVYEIAGKNDGRILGIFPVSFDVKATIDARTGETIDVEKPWWSLIVV